MEKKAALWQGKEKRRHPRKGVWLEIYYEHLGDFFNDYAVNLSRSGLFVKTARPIPIGTEIKLRFAVPGKKDAVETSGRVARIVNQNNPQGHPPGIGIEFSALSERDIALLNSLWEEEKESAEKKTSKVKHCPKCKMVHSEADYICRRCRVDLATGEPVALPAIRQKSGEDLLREKLRDSRNLIQKPLVFFSKTLNKIRAKIPAPKLKAKETDQITALIYCMKCGGEMKPATVPFYPARILYPFLGLSVALFGLGFLFTGLILPGILSLACFVIYFRLREELWLCGECGSYHKKKKKKKQKLSPAQGTEIRSDPESRL